MTILVRMDSLMPEIPNGVTVNSVDWEIYSVADINVANGTINAGAVPAYDSPNDTVNLKTLYRILPNDTYYGRTRVTTSIGTTDWSPLAPCSNDIARPDITISGFPAAVPNTPTFTSSPFSVPTGSPWSHSDTLWKVADSDGEIVWSGSTGTTLTVSVPPGYLVAGRAYSVHVTHVGIDGGGNTLESPMGVEDFNVEGAIIAAPNVTIVGTPTTATGLTATTSGFSVLAGSDFHTATSWVVADGAGNDLISILNDSVDLTQNTINIASLAPGVTYYLKVTHHGNTASSPTAVVSFLLNS